MIEEVRVCACVRNIKTHVTFEYIPRSQTLVNASSNLHLALSSKLLKPDDASFDTSIAMVSFTHSWISARIRVRWWAVVSEFAPDGTKGGTKETVPPGEDITAMSDSVKNSEISEM